MTWASASKVLANMPAYAEIGRKYVRARGQEWTKRDYASMKKLAIGNW
jgi:hypothetical protein